MAWQDEKSLHAIVYMDGNELLCSCGQKFQVRRRDSGLSKNVRYNILMDLQSLHKKLEENK